MVFIAGVITAITSVFTAVWTWITNAITTMIPVFYTAGTGEQAGELTFLGTLSLIGLGISVFFLIMGLIQNFLHFRG